MSNKESEINFELKAIAKSSIVVFVFLLFSKIIAYFYRIILARYFGPEIYGSFSLAIMVAGFFVLFSVLGFDEGLLRFIPFYRGKKDDKSINEILNFSRNIVCILSIFFGILMFTLSGFLAEKIFHDSSLKLFFEIFSISIPFAANFRIYTSAIRGYEKIGTSSFLNNFLDGFSKLLFLMCFIYFGLGVLSVHLSYVLSWVTLFLFSYLLFKKFSKLKKNKFPKKSSKKEFIDYSWPLLFTTLIATLFSWTDVFFIGFFKSTFEVGIYNAAIPLAAFVYFVPNLFVQLFAPMINKNYSEGKIDLIKDLSKQIGKWIFIFNLPLLIIILFFPGVLINLLFGGEYISASIPLVFLAIGYFSYALFTPSYYLLNMLGKSKISLINISITSVINIVLNIILIPLYGISGAAFSTMFSFIIFSIITSIEVYYFTKIMPLRRKMFNIASVGLISILAVFLIKKFIVINKLSVILTGIFFLLFYILFIFLTKSLDKNDLMILKTIKNKIKK